MEQCLSLLEHLLHPRLASWLLTRFFIPAPPVLLLALIIVVSRRRWRGHHQALLHPPLAVLHVLMCDACLRLGHLPLQVVCLLCEPLVQLAQLPVDLSHLLVPLASSEHAL